MPKGIVLEQRMADMMEKALVALEDQGHHPRDMIFFMWPWNWNPPTNNAGPSTLKPQPGLTMEEKTLFQSEFRMRDVFFAKTKMHRLHAENVKIAEARKRKREDTGQVCANVYQFTVYCLTCCRIGDGPKNDWTWTYSRLMLQMIRTTRYVRMHITSLCTV